MYRENDLNVRKVRILKCFYQTRIEILLFNYVFKEDLEDVYFIKVIYISGKMIDVFEKFSGDYLLQVKVDRGDDVGRGQEIIFNYQRKGGYNY